MQTAKIDRSARRAQFVPLLVSAAIVLVVMLAAAIYGNNIYQAFRPASLPQGTISISQTALEAQYGLRVNLVAVTAAGGMVDLRLKMIDAEKAKALLQDKANFPALYVETGNRMLKTSADVQSQEIEFEDGGNLYLLFPNSGNVVKHGTAVNILFGDTLLEPIEAK